MIEIELPSKKHPGHVVLIDDEDEEIVREHHWYANVKNEGRIVYAYCDKLKMKLGRFLLRPEPHLRVIYLNGNALDCRRENLSVVEHFKSTRHRGKKPYSRTGFRGVYVAHSGRYRAIIRANAVRHCLGTYDDPEDAAIAYDLAAYEFYGSAAITNEKLGLL